MTSRKTSINSAKPIPVRQGMEERILQAAVSLFAHFGYNGVSTREIAAAAEVSEVTIYRHFSRKHDLYLRVLNSELQRVHLRGDLLTGLAEAQTAQAALTCTFELISQALLRQPQLLRLLGFSMLELNGELDPLLHRHLGEMLELIARYLQPWVERGELRCVNAKTLVLTLVAIVLSHGPVLRIFAGDSPAPEALYEAYAEFSFAGKPYRECASDISG